MRTETILDESSSGNGLEEGRFPAGTVLAGRYRVLGMIGRGGMGEVYRAYDLILNQAVALKFLGPANLSEAALARFRNEVRIARQVSHPNVCRVYDIGFIDGFHFLSMEYLDGEDLASLIRRIGRLPQDKAIEFTRKICAGLAAAHERGVLHRDLKPANIMIDGRGHLRITDFGLAALAREVALGDIRSGTPAYMSPEQKAGKEVTARSDIYSLGLTLHEMFTGKRRSGTRTDPGEIVKDLDPAVERVILRCIEEDPQRRPSSALSVAMALPGGDPIAAALAAGETPSPEMVAASGEKEGFRPRTAVLCFLAGVLGFLGAALLYGRVSFLSRARLELPPEALAYRAAELLRQLGYTEKPVANAYGFDYFAPEYVAYLNRSRSANRDELLASHHPAVTGFWYRQQQGRIWAEGALRGGFAGGEVRYDRPANSEPGVIRLTLDGEGRLYSLEAHPVANGGNPGTSAPDWNALFNASGLVLSRFTAVPPAEIPGMPFSARMAWTGTFGEGRTEKIRVEAAFWQERPVYFRITGDWDHPQSAPAGDVGGFIIVSVLAGAGLVAWNNLRLGRCDRRGAARVAVFTCLLVMCEWAFGAEHIASYWEPYLAISALSLAAFMAGLFWLFYIAIEPYVRRHWPDALISWSRLQTGRMRDPLVASHILAGLAISGLLCVFSMAVELASGSLFDAALVPFESSLRPLNSVATFVSHLFLGAFGGTLIAFAFTFFVVVSRLLIRRTAIADIAASMLFGAALLPDVLFAAVNAFAFYITAWLLRRFGLLAAWTSLVAAQFVWMVPLILPSWYAGRALVSIAIPSAMAAWALWVILSSQLRPVTESMG